MKRSKNKPRYSLNDVNRLVVKRDREHIIADGSFSIDKNNRLVYWLNEPRAWRRKYALPSKIIFQGHWRLNPNYDLELNLDQTRQQYAENRLILKGEIISVDNDALTFEIKSRDKDGQGHIQILKLSGSWKADEHNQLSFVVKRKREPDILTLEGAWQINSQQQIIYTYEKTNLKTKDKTCRTLVFTGFWQINQNNRLTYILSRSSASRFDLRAQVETPNLYPQQGVIKYRMGIGLKGLSPKGTVPKIVSLYGAWKFSRRLGLLFQMDYGEGRVQNLEFGAEVSPWLKDKITLELTNKKGGHLGLCLTFTHRFLRKLDAEAFLRLQRIQQESRLESGVRIPF